MSASLQLNGNMTATDNTTGAVALTKVFTGITSTCSVWEQLAAVSVGTSPTSVTLPISPVQFLYLKNTHTSQTLSVTWTPNGGSSNPVIVLEPSSAIVFSENTSGGGITALSVTGSGASTSYEGIIGG
jgi:hypothetical protein